MIVHPFDPPAPGEAVEIAEGVFWLRLPLPMALDHVDVYALRERGGWCIVDTGLDTRKVRAIWEEVLDGPLGGDPVHRVIVTHHHPDHVGLAGWFMERGAELWMTRTAWLLARMLVLDDQERPTPEALEFLRGAGMPAAMLEKRAAERPFNFADVVAPLPLGFRRVTEGEALEIGGRTWDVVMGHGHAPEHLTLWAREEPLVIGGDQLLSSISPNLGVYPTEPMADPVADWLASCEALKPLARNDHLVLPGHRRPYRGLPERLEQLAQNHRGALDRLRAHLETPRTAVECFAPLFKREIDEGTYGLALAEAVGHLNHLLARGEVTRERRADGAWLWRMADGG